MKSSFLCFIWLKIIDSFQKICIIKTAFDMETKMKTVFLSGPMRGVPRDIAKAWRDEAALLLKEKFLTLHAYRGREDKETFPDPKGAVLRDKQDIRRSDIVLVNDTFEGASMIGTSMEVLYAYNCEKIIIVFGNAHKGDYWLDFHCTMRVENLQQACEICLKLFHD